MSFDPELFGQAMGDAIIKAVQPLKEEIARLKSQLAEMPKPIAGKDGVNGRDGKDCDMEVVRQMVEDAVKAIPVVQGKDGADGKDGQDGPQGVPGEKGADGAGIADLLINRDGELVATFTDGRMKNLGEIVGKDGSDGRDGRDGADGVGLDSFDLEYLGDTHEICIKAVCAGRVKEIRYPAGGIHGKGYWREGVKVAAGDAWVHDGSLWIAKRSTPGKPSSQSDDWFLAARRGRDGERGERGKDASNTSSVMLKT